MAFDLQTALPKILPAAISLAKNQSENATRLGRPLDDGLISIARNVGVAHPERIRILEVMHLPQPDEPLLKQAADATGLLSSDKVGLTLWYAVFACSGYAQDLRLLSHEFRHVHQYEAEGSIESFLTKYLQQIATVGYRDAAFEIDARAHELST
jgi:hypothetical protein